MTSGSVEGGDWLGVAEDSAPSDVGEGVAPFDVGGVVAPIRRTGTAQVRLIGSWCLRFRLGFVLTFLRSLFR